MAAWSDREGQLQIALVRWLRLSLPVGWLAIHPANGGLRNKREAAKFKAMGVLAGYPDIVIHGALEAPGELSTCRSTLQSWTGFIEVKSPAIRVNGKLFKAAGRLSAEQHDCHDRLRDLGFKVGVVSSIDETRAFCKLWRLPIRDVTADTLFAARAA